MRPTALLRRCAARYGDPFTLRTLWADGPMVLTADPDAIGRIFRGEGVRGGGTAPLLEPFAGPTSLLVSSGEEHLRRRRLMLPPFHGERLESYRAEIAQLARAEIASWPTGELRAHDRMRALTLEVILRVVIGDRDRALHAAVSRALSLTHSSPRLVAMSLGARAGFERAVREVDALLHARIRAASPGEESVLGDLVAARHDDGSEPSMDEVRDQLVTLLAAGHETTATALAWATERLARHPEVVAWIRAGGDDELEATAKEVLRLRPVLSIAPRQVVEPFAIGDHVLAPGANVAACIYLVHRRADQFGPDPLAFRPQRWLSGEPTGLWMPFGGGVRRCLGASFALLEMVEVLRAVVTTVDLSASEPGERMRRRSVTLAPARGARVIATPR